MSSPERNPAWTAYLKPTLLPSNLVTSCCLFHCLHPRLKTCCFLIHLISRVLTLFSIEAAGRLTSLYFQCLLQHLAQSRCLGNIWWIRKWRWLNSESIRQWQREGTEPLGAVRGTRTFPPRHRWDADPSHPEGGGKAEEWGQIFTMTSKADSSSTQQQHKCAIPKVQTFTQNSYSKIIFKEKNTTYMRVFYFKCLKWFPMKI